MRFILFILFTFPVFAQVEDIGLRTRIDGFFGSVGFCQDLSVKDLKEVDECVSEYTLPKISHAVAELNLENYLEELIFNELARRSHNVVNCQIDFFDSLKPEFKSAIEQRSWQAFQRAAPQIKELLQLRAERQSYKGNVSSTIDPMDRSTAQLEQRKKIRQAAEEIKAIDQAISSITAQIPLGQHSEVSQALVNHSLSGSSEENFHAAYWSSVRKLKSQVSAASQTYKKLQQKDGLYKLSRTEKITFVKSGQAEAMIDRMELSPRVKTNVKCRIRARYLNGPTTTGALGTIALVGGGFATGGISSVALRGVASLGISTAAAVDLSMTVRDQCLAHTVNVSAADHPQCSAEEFVNSSISESNFNTCSTALVFAASPLLARFGGKIVSQFRRSPGLEPPTQIEIVNPKIKNGLFDIKKTDIYSDDAVVVGVADNGHMYMVAGGKRFDGEPLTRASKVRKSTLGSEGVFFKIDLSPERALKVKQAIEAQAGSRNLSCIHGACRILQQNDIVIASEKPGVMLRIRPIMQGLTKGDVTVGGKSSNVRMFASSQESFDQFIQNMPTKMKQKRNMVLTTYGLTATNVGMLGISAYEIIEE